MKTELKATDLRIGNYVQYKKGHFCKIIGLYSNKLDIIEVIGIKDDYINGNYNIEEFKPIPLTEEILLKCGLSINKWFCENSFCVVEDRTGDTHYGWCMKVQNASHTKEIEFGYFKYVHQLQNLYFALTGEELTINL